MLIKVCGMRQPDNIRALQSLPVHFMGLIFHEKSPRNVTKKIPVPLLNKEMIPRIGVFVDKPIDFIAQKISDYRLAGVQLHGKETPQFCEKLRNKFPEIYVFKAFSVDKEFDFSVTKPYENIANFLIFDTKGENAGGNGVSFDWTLLKKYEGSVPFFLSGGIREADAAPILYLAFPYLVGVDINSRFETEPAFKDMEKINNFISAMTEV
jgi:phosphoribosylanthranilate isomerase